MPVSHNTWQTDIEQWFINDIMLAGAWSVTLLREDWVIMKCIIDALDIARRSCC